MMKRDRGIKMGIILNLLTQKHGTFFFPKLSEVKKLLRVMTYISKDLETSIEDEYWEKS